MLALRQVWGVSRYVLVAIAADLGVGDWLGYRRIDRLADHHVLVAGVEP